MTKKNEKKIWTKERKEERKMSKKKGEKIWTKGRKEEKKMNNEKGKVFERMRERKKEE